MSDRQIQFSGDGLEITVRGASTRFSGMDLHTAAIVALIEETDTHFEEKLRMEKGEGGNVASEFYETVLAAIARHYADTASEVGDDVNEDQHSVAQILERLVGELREEGRL